MRLFRFEIELQLEDDAFDGADLTDAGISAIWQQIVGMKGILRPLGWPHPDGIVRQYAPPPKGYRLGRRTSVGRPENLGEDDEEILFALPEGVRFPEDFVLTHDELDDSRFVPKAEEVHPDILVFVEEAWVPWRDSRIFKEIRR